MPLRQAAVPTDCI